MKDKKIRLFSYLLVYATLFTVSVVHPFPPVKYDSESKRPYCMWLLAEVQ